MGEVTVLVEVVVNCPPRRQLLGASHAGPACVVRDVVYFLCLIGSVVASRECLEGKLLYVSRTHLIQRNLTALDRRLRPLVPSLGIVLIELVGQPSVLVSPAVSKEVVLLPLDLLLRRQAVVVVTLLLGHDVVVVVRPALRVDCIEIKQVV